MGKKERATHTNDVRARLNEALFEIMDGYGGRIKTDISPFRVELSGMGNVTSIITPKGGNITYILYEFLIVRKYNRGFIIVWEFRTHFITL